MALRSSLRLQIIAAVLCVLPVTAASAGTISTWTRGGSSGDWATAANWDPSANAPTTSGTYSLTFSGTAGAQGLGTAANPLVVSTTNTLGLVTIDSLNFANTGTLSPSGNAFFTITGGTLALQSATITTASGTGGQFTSNSDGDIINSALTISGVTTVTIGSLHNLSVIGGISGNGSLVFNDNGANTTEYVYLSGSNTYTGGTLIKGGFVQSGGRSSNTGGFSTAISNDFAFGSGTVTIQDTGTLLVRNNSVISNVITVSGAGQSGSSLTGSFGVAGSIAEVRGPITLAGSTQFSTASNATADTTSKLLLSGTVDLGANVLTLRSGIRSGETLGLLIEQTGRVTGSGGVVIAGSGSGSRVLMSGSNDYTGGTTVTTGTLSVGNSYALGTGFLAVNTSGLDLNGRSLFVGALSGSSSGVIQSNVAGAASLTTTAATDSTYNGTIINGNGTVSLAKAGAGSLTLTASNSYTGRTSINGGNLVVDNVSAIGTSGTVTFGGGTLKYTANNQVDYSSRFKSSGGAISIDTNGQNVTFASGIDSSNTGGLTKRGAGTLFVNGSNSYTGNSLVEAGTLGGNGTIAGLVTVGTNAVLAPGSTAGAIGTLSVGSLELQAGAMAMMQISGTAAGLYDQVATTSGVTYGGTLAIDFTTGGFANFDFWQLFSGSPQGGHFSSVSATGAYGNLTFAYLGGGEWKATGGSLAAGQSLSFYEDNSHAFGGKFAAGQLVLVPEPSTVALVGIGAALFGWRSLNRRRGSARRPR